MKHLLCEMQKCLFLRGTAALPSDHQVRFSVIIMAVRDGVRRQHLLFLF